MTRSALAAIAIAASLVAACTHVAPYERERLARPGMETTEREGLAEGFVAHVQDAREGGGGATESAGGGCGCN